MKIGGRSGKCGSPTGMGESIKAREECSGGKGGEEISTGMLFSREVQHKVGIATER